MNGSIVEHKGEQVYKTLLEIVRFFCVYIPFITIAGVSENHLATLGFGTLIILGIFLFLLYRIFAIFKYTHSTRFFKLMLVI